MTNVSAVEKMAELMQQMEENSPRVAALQYCLKQVAEKVEEAEKRNAELESRYSELAAELRAVEEIHNEAVFITDEHYEQCPPEVQKIIRSLAVMQIPAYQAFLAEVRAQGVERYAEQLTSEAERAEETGWDGAAKFLRSESEKVREFAAQLRKGVQS
ncbi:hypothetical protein KC310_06210 [Enterobacter hormaechei subsp. xiangfangensis]|uniref:hypothetical protein n=1 Tax=Enterobacter hormaechei TaxID=158836 RepID=UPI00256B27C1|nr:hypothetical protein [Enterobacter hormaechei]MDL4067414.1 hypothetical protein [Enterobacter hormaechei subsp. xiangfangensis]MDR9999266.1 hypothetical protein [Enterobacter hormaechei subsp. xiangfangensis]